MEIKSGLAHCCHHDRHWEFCFDFDERVKYIKENKPVEEQALRLRLFQIVPDELLPGKDSPAWEASNKAWEASNKAWEASTKSWEASTKAWEASTKAWEAYNKAWEAYLLKYQGELNTLHDKLFPDCPWNGKSIFKEEQWKS